MTDTDLKSRSITGTQARRPKPYQVTVYNDDYTPLDFVVGLLSEVFQLSADVAKAKTMEIHSQGRTNCGPFSFEIAETKATEVMDRATQAGHPLLARSRPSY